MLEVQRPDIGNESVRGAGAVGWFTPAGSKLRPKVNQYLCIVNAARNAIIWPYYWIETPAMTETDSHIQVSRFTSSGVARVLVGYARPVVS